MLFRAASLGQSPPLHCGLRTTPGTKISPLRSASADSDTCSRNPCRHRPASPPDQVRRGLRCRQQLVHRSLPLARGKAHQQRERLGPSQSFARRPLREGRAENLGSRTLGQQLDLKAIEHRVSGFSQTKFLGTHLRHMRAQRLRSHPGLFDFSVHLAQQRSPHGFQCW